MASRRGDSCRAGSARSTRTSGRSTVSEGIRVPRASPAKKTTASLMTAPVSYRGGAAPFEASGGTAGPAGHPGQGAGIDVPMDPDDRKALIKYVIGYSLAIGAVFAVIFGIVIFLMWKFW